MKSTMVMALLVALVGLVSCGGKQTVGAAQTPVERGKYLVTGMGCGDCHTPLKMGARGPEPDMARLYSGHPAELTAPPPRLEPGPWGIAMTLTSTGFAGPWGVSYAANLTSDDETGLGVWTEEMFLKAIREGKHLGAGREILPPMPWPAYRNLSDEDLKAIFAYLKSLPPIKNKVPDAVLAPPPAH
jgi:mono/diheme cytochrome c family protein